MSCLFGRAEETSPKERNRRGLPHLGPGFRGTKGFQGASIGGEAARKGAASKAKIDMHGKHVPNENRSGIVFFRNRVYISHINLNVYIPALTKTPLKERKITT